MNTHINKNRKKPTHERRYLGITVTAENYRELMSLAIADKKNPRHEINYHTRHLEAYLKGKETFRHGYRIRVNEDGEVETLGPAYFKVMQEWISIEE